MAQPAKKGFLYDDEDEEDDFKPPAKAPLPTIGAKPQGKTVVVP